jgi:hypothetical protein
MFGVSANTATAMNRIAEVVGIVALMVLTGAFNLVAGIHSPDH